MSRTLSGMFLVGASDETEKREKGPNGKIPPKSGNSQKNREVPKKTEKDKNGRTKSGNPPV